MKFAVYTVFSMILAAGSATAAADQAAELKTDNEKFSYALGLDAGTYIKTEFKGVELDLEKIQQGIKDAYTPGSKPLMTEEEALQAQKDFSKRMVAANKEKAKKFLEENKKKAEVKTTESGLQYKVVKQGKGATPTADDTVKVHYRGTLLDGTEFDSSKKKGPVQFPVKGVIPGWTEALQLMKEGSIYELYLPPALAYGDNGASPVIKPGSLLIFEVELLEIIKPEKKQKEPIEEKKQKK